MAVTVTARRQKGREWEYQVKDSDGKEYNSGEWIKEARFV
jgi:hypothetical protein